VNDAPHAEAPAPALSVERLVRRFQRADGHLVTAVDGVSFSVAAGETLGLVGESGCGKSSLAHAVLLSPRPEAGKVKLGGEDFTTAPASVRRELRRRIQMVFQDPISSLNPRRTVADIVAEPLSVWQGGDATQHRDQVVAALGEVGFDADQVWHRRPHEMSGGQCQRVAIARALMLKPAVLVLDEPVSALDVSVQAQILNLLVDIRARHTFSMVFISHDLAVIRSICDRVAVMYLGRIVEVGDTETIYRQPRHPYTRALLESVLWPGRQLPEQEVISGDMPSLIHPPSGCHFRTRCTRASAHCAGEVPVLMPHSGVHSSACFHPLHERPEVPA
jgi:peptide/nickel transport system ATP-binding protein